MQHRVLHRGVGGLSGNPLVRVSQGSGERRGMGTFLQRRSICKVMAVERGRGWCIRAAMRGSDLSGRIELVRNVYLFCKLTLSTLFQYRLFEWSLLFKAQMPCPVLSLKSERCVQVYSHVYPPVCLKSENRAQMSSKC